MVDLNYSLITKKLKDIHEHHDNVKVEHQCSDNVIIMVNFDAIVLFLSADDSCVNDQIESINQDTKCTANNMKGS